MTCCKLSLTIVCIITTLASVLVLAIQIISASTTAWVHLKNRRTSFSYGLYRLEDHIGLVTVKIVKSTPLVVMQAMAVFSIASGLFGTILTILGATQRTICGRSTKFFIILAQIFISLSAIFYLIGVATFTHFWLKNPSKFFQTLPTGKNEFIYGYAYWLSWLALFCQLGVMVFLIVSVNCIIRPKDKRLAGYEELNKSPKEVSEGSRLVDNQNLPKSPMKIEEDKRSIENADSEISKIEEEKVRNKGLEETATSVVEKAIVEGINKAETSKPSTSP